MLFPGFPQNRETGKWEAQNREIPVLVSDLVYPIVRQYIIRFQHLNVLLRNIIHLTGRESYSEIYLARGSVDNYYLSEANGRIVKQR